MGDSDYKNVYTVIDRGGDKKAVWVRIGAAFVNRDGSLNVKLDALPLNGTLQIRDRDRDDEARDGDNRAPRNDNQRRDDRDRGRR